ncbi:HAD family hydrolase [Antarcticibacterium flavum]|uniref:phosphoglycolate phosphatase n=1 Tax=Antarcticibacterium flavum TaxID=2058175 RepID=A0A5B7WZ86_9FLAO|nr:MULTISPECIES: HAD hydrolase-like protein [Antarcticibacterium]MCM4161254.1 haloacid dehalogenase [Antarcticibacterium sp. W02-3]QCY68429.1 HAD family hydrolase [Antarcticibacterium flavum]
MKEFENKKVILWDFDGVILDSMQVREKGFREVLANYPQEQVEKLLEYHNQNGGLSRYVKFRYFLEEILQEETNDEKVAGMAGEFSEIMRKELTTKDNLIAEVLDFIEAQHTRFEMHIVSGSDGDELRYLTSQLGISGYFNSIEGSPTPKISLVRDILQKHKYNRDEVCLIGDSINDYDAAHENRIDFFGYNNPHLKAKGLAYIEAFS